MSESRGNSGVQASRMGGGAAAVAVPEIRSVVLSRLMATKYAIGHSGAKLVRVHFEGGQTQVYAAADELVSRERDLFPLDSIARQQWQAQRLGIVCIQLHGRKPAVVKT